MSQLFGGREFDAGIPPEEQDRLSGGNDYPAPRDGCLFPQRGVPVTDLLSYSGDKVGIVKFLGGENDPNNAQSFRRMGAAVSDSAAPPGARSGIPITAVADSDTTGPYSVAQAFCVQGTDQWTVNAALYGATPEQVRDGVDVLLADVGCSPALAQ